MLHVVSLDPLKIDAIFAELDQSHLPGAAVGIALGGKPIYRKGFGLASMELPVLLSPSIRMRIGSTTKHFTCLAYMLVCQDGKASISDPIGKYFPELHPVTHKVTMQQLMGNTSGLRDACNIRWDFSGTDHLVSTAELLSLYRDIDDVNFTPGTSWCYNNGGFVLLTVAIERIMGQPLEDVLRERIFEPVGMHDTLLRRYDNDFVPNSATMHMTSRAGGYDRSFLGGALSGEGGMVSTVDDMLRWLAHMDAPTVGSAKTWSVMKTPQVLANGTLSRYGFGLVRDSYRGVETLHHAGGVMGANSQMLKVPGADLDIVIMVNRHDVSAARLANRIVDACLNGLDPPKVAASRRFVAGIFRSPSTGRVIQFRNSSPVAHWEGMDLFASINGCDTPVEPDDNGVLRAAGMASVSKIAITLQDGPGNPASIRYDSFGNCDELFGVGPSERADMDAIVGQYRSSATSTEATISNTDGGPRLTTSGRFGSADFSLECLADGIWRSKSRNSMATGILLFDANDKGFGYSNYSTWGLPFSRLD